MLTYICVNKYTHTIGLYYTLALVEQLIEALKPYYCVALYYRDNVHLNGSYAHYLAK